MKTYFKLAFRNLWKNKVYASINILGLAVGLSSFLLILLYLNYELSYDSWNPELKKVFKVSIEGPQNNIAQTTPAPLAGLLADQSADIQAATRTSAGDIDFVMPIAAGGKVISQKGTLSADSLFFKVFPYTILAGEQTAPLDKPDAAVISQRLAKKLFGAQNPIGQTIRIFNSFDRQVTAVMEDVQAPSHLPVEMVFRSPYEQSNMHWGNWSYHTYIKVKEPMGNAQAEETINRVFYANRIDKADAAKYSDYQNSTSLQHLFVDQVGDIHNFPKHGSSNFSNISILLGLSLLLLFAGAINFSNLSVASSLSRAKEIGIKKVLGSSRSALFWQFMGEIALQCLFALLLSFLLLQIALPFFNQEFALDLGLFDVHFSWTFGLQLLACLLLVTLLSGLYPAVFLSRYNISKVLKKDYSNGKQGTLLRSSLIVVQFVVATFFIIGIVIVSKQLHYMQQLDKGFSGKQVLTLRAMKQQNREEDYPQVKARLLSIAGVEQVSKSTKIPGASASDTATVDFTYQNEKYALSSVKIDKDYFKTLDIPLLKGRELGMSYPDQHTQSAIINETAAKKLGITELAGQHISFPYCDSIRTEIVGIVKDFNVLGMEQKIEPTVFTIGNDACMFQSGGYLLLKLSEGNPSSTLKQIEDLWTELEPDLGFQYSFLDEDFQRLFTNHRRVQGIVSFFGGTAIAIALIGLFALSAFLMGRRTKEISIRKILGADFRDLGILLGKDFIRLIFVSTLISVPLAWWGADAWLQRFAYRMPLRLELFAFAAGLVLLVALGTILINVRKVQRSNISQNLKHE